jgi:hypothetical protein
MQTWIDQCFVLHPHEHLLLTVHPEIEAITLYRAGYHGDGHGLSLQLSPAHLPELRAAVHALEALAEQADMELPFNGATA